MRIRPSVAVVLVASLMAWHAGGSVVHAQQDGLSGQAPSADMVRAVRGAVVRIVATGGRSGTDSEPAQGSWSGSGFFVDPAGLVVTVNHVVAGAETLGIIVDGATDPVPATVVAYSECADLAVLRTDLSVDHHLLWSSDFPAVGQPVYSAGFPDGDPRFTLVDGFISREPGPSGSRWAAVDRELEHTADIRGGNSGGPLVAPDGSVVGVNYAGLDGRSFAIAADEAAQVATLLATGADIGSLGMFGEVELGGDGMPVGLRVEAVDPEGPAARAGVMVGDLVTSLDGQPVGEDGSLRDYCAAAWDADPSTAVAIGLVRGGAELEGALFGEAVSPVVPPIVKGWSTPISVAPGPVTNPRMVRDDAGDLHVAWSGGGIDGRPGIYHATFDGATWSVERITRQRDFAPWITLDERGEVHIVFDREETARSSRSAGIFEATREGDGWRIERLTRGDDTGAILRFFGSDRHLAFERGGVVVYTTDAGGRWQTRRLGRVSGCCGLALRLDDSGAAHVAWSSSEALDYSTNSGRSGWRHYSWRARSGTVGGPAMSIGDDQVPRLLFRLDDRLVFARIDDPSVSELPTDTIASVNPMGILSPRLILTDADRPIVAWGEMLGADSGVFLARKRDGEWRVQRVGQDTLDTSPSLTLTDGALHLVYDGGADGLVYQVEH